MKKRKNPFTGKAYNSTEKNLSSELDKMSLEELVEELRDMEKTIGKEKFNQILKENLTDFKDQQPTDDFLTDNDLYYDPVTTIEWNFTHPAYLKCGSDRYYADLANELKDVIDKFKLPSSAPDGLARELGRVLAAYLEDIVSGTHVFSAMRSVCMQRYGFLLPFFDCDHPDYMSDHINEEDIRFLIWKTACQLGHKKDLIYSPLAPGWDLLAGRAFDLLNSRYEDAPESRRVTDWLKRSIKKEDYINIRQIAEWLVLRNPLCYIPAYLEEIYESLRDAAMKNDFDDIRLEQATYGIIAQEAWQRSMSPMGCPSTTLVAAIAAEFGYNSIAKDIEDIEVLPSQVYAVSQDRKNRKIIFETSSNDKLEVVRESFSKGFRPEDTTYAQCILIKFKGKYFLNGILSGNQSLKEKWETQPQLLTFEQQRLKVKDWLEILDGQQAVCVTNARTLLHKLGFSGIGAIDTPEAKNYVALISYEMGLALLPDMGYAFKIPGNRFYRKRVASKEAFPDIIFNNSIPHDVATYIDKNHLLPDACIGASQGKEAGLKIVQDYLSFWIGFYRKLPPYGNAPIPRTDDIAEE